MREEDQRRIRRVSVCCRVDVRDHFGIWTAVTADVCARGCRIVTTKLPRVGSTCELVISSDLFPESLEVAGEVAWVSEDHVGVNFVETPAPPTAAAGRRRRLSPAEWVDAVIEHGRVAGASLGSAAPRVAPVVRRPAGRRGGRREARGAADGSDEPAAVLPLKKR